MFELKRRIAQYCADLVSSIVLLFTRRRSVSLLSLELTGVSCMSVSQFNVRGSIVSVTDAHVVGMCS